MGIEIQIYVGDNDTLKDHPNITPDGWIPLGGGHGCCDEDEMREYVAKFDGKNMRLRIAEIEGPTRDLSPARPKIKDDKWPKDGKPADFSDLVEPVVKALRFCYSMRRKNQGIDVPWNGHNIGRDELVTCFDPLYALSAEMLTYDKEDQGREAVEVIVGIALQLGIEQGRRIERTSDRRRHEDFMREMDQLIIKSLKEEIERLKDQVAM